MQYYQGDALTGAVEPIQYISPVSSVWLSTHTSQTGVCQVDDEKSLADQAAELIERSVAVGEPFLAVVFFHGVHIPYIASPETRAKYAAKNSSMTVNEQDYWCVTC